MRYPKEVPILSESDFHCGPSEKFEQKTHCLVEWSNLIFNAKKVESLPAASFLDNDNLLSYNFLRTMNESIDDTNLPFNGHDENDFGSRILFFNDDPSITNKDRAKVWNETMRKLGYTE